ncbi:T9SS-dependent choice-of-anchor J family protein [Flavobacterium poyangense]|uniref:T9SS-dependent choice-of-anchor J family protein n=1 Tax=Flavobacterium poyangense TaxID=2204302 RepID=UPI00141F0F11|nr:choice-of-anchor J domain-containing protein [Flavobacterium sp. JXAS1]
MKKKLLVLVFILISGMASAQYAIWEDDFDDAEASDWTFLDADGDAKNWITRTNIQINENGVITDGTYKVLGTYNIDMASGAPLGVEQKNWAIMPEIDLSFYGGSMQLVLNAQKAIYDGPDNLYVYASTTDKDPKSFTQIGAIELTRATTLDAEFKDYTVDISQFAGKTKVYFAVLNAPNFVVGYEIDKVSITVASLGLKDVLGKKEIALKQNPVENDLQLELDSTINEEEITLKVYNTTGVLVKESKYNKAGISISNLTAGVYFLVIKYGDAAERIKFIKK